MAQRALKTATLAMALITTAAIAQSSDNFRTGLFDFVRSTPKTGSPAVWLVMKNVMGGYEQTALIFGYADNLGFCTDVAKLYMSRYASETYTCVPELQ